MREVDTASPVVWPAWCYSGESEESKMTTVEAGTGVKSERLSPGGDSCSRSGTPSSSYTPPGVSPTALPPPPALPRNYSEFMRSLAAKYNNNHPNDYFSGRNGFGVKAGASPPFLVPAPATGGAKDEDSKPEMGFFPPIFSPVIDMNATQALLSMVRTHGAAHQLETYLKGASKRSPSDNSPLDLSSSGGNTGTGPAVGSERKRAKKASLGESLYGTSAALLRGPKARKQPAPARCASACSPHASPDSQNVAHWSVEDVANFVQTVDMCAEYAPKFREQRIDGSSLPLLTEDHLTSRLGMRLGPALKLRSILSSRLGQCPVCLHCAHCHQQPQEK